MRLECRCRLLNPSGDETIPDLPAGRREFRARFSWSLMTPQGHDPVDRIESARSVKSTAAFRVSGRRLRVDHCLPRTSAIRWLKLGVSFPALRSRARPAQADPKQKLI